MAAATRPSAPAFAVCVHDVGALAPEEAHERDERAQVRKRPRRARKPRKPHEPHPGRAREVGHVGLAGREVAGHEHGLVPVGRKPRRKRDHVLRRAAHVQAGDGAADPDRARPPHARGYRGLPVPSLRIMST